MCTPHDTTLLHDATIDGAMFTSYHIMVWGGGLGTAALDNPYLPSLGS